MQAMDKIASKKELSKYLCEKEYKKVAREAFESPSLRIKDQLENVTNLVKIKGGKLILDIGCGTGKYDAIFSREATIVGIDFSPVAIRVSRESVNKYGIPENAKFCQSLCEILPFKDNAFDGVMCIDMVEHLYPEDFQSLVKETYRVLKDKGKLWIYTPNKTHISEYIKKVLTKEEVGHIGLQTAQSIVKQLIEDNYSVIKLYHCPSHFPIYKEIERVMMHVPFIGRYFKKRICIAAKKMAI